MAPSPSSQRWSCSAGDLPEDLVMEILSRLPVASLLRCKSVCKWWLHLIQSSSFINHHLRHHAGTADHSFFAMYDTHTLDNSRFRLHFSLVSSQNLVFSKDINFPDTCKSIFYVNIVSCDGLLCLYYVWRKVSPRTHTLDGMCFVDVTLYNPATKHFRALPQPVLPAKPRHMTTWAPSIGLGFDILTGDYKLVLVFVYKETRSQVQVYSLTTNSWRAIHGAFPIDIVMSIGSHPIEPYTNGTYCWFGTSYSNFQNNNHLVLFDHYVVSFDFSTEKFETIPLPDAFSVRVDPYPRFAILDGNIACVSTIRTSYTSERFEIWVLNEYGVKGSWTKLYTIGPFSNCTPKGILKNRFVLFANTSKGNQLRIYDMITGESKNIALEKDQCWEQSRTCIAMYKESLVSIKREDDAWDGANSVDWYTWLPKWIM